jgi:CDP-glycerol glycerophosphotransferase (TagB/SpsB family)
LSDTGQLASLGSHARAAADLHGVSIVVKPHPMDRDTYAGIPGLRTVDDAALNEIGISLYQVVGASSGLITDYSSIWTDYLVVDRPVLLFCPDYEEYAATRGFNVPDLRAVAPGPVVTDIEALADFVSDVAAGRDPHRSRRHALAGQIGGVTEPGASERLWQAISDLRRAEVRRPSVSPELVA